MTSDICEKENNHGVKLAVTYYGSCHFATQIENQAHTYLVLHLLNAYGWEGVWIVRTSQCSVHRK